MVTERGLVVVAPDEGREVVRLNGERTIIKVGREATRGAYAVRENGAPPGYASVPLHMDPRGMVHALANPGAEPVRWLTLISPADRSEWVEAEHELLLASDGEPDRTRWSRSTGATGWRSSDRRRGGDAPVRRGICAPRRRRTGSG